MTNKTSRVESRRTPSKVDRKGINQPMPIIIQELASYAYGKHGLLQSARASGLVSQLVSQPVNRLVSEAVK